jgi:capsular exopolysaccharide synthesis family protein
MFKDSQERSLTLHSDPERSVAMPAAGPWLDVDLDGPGTPLSHYLWVLKKQRLKIASFVIAATMATLMIVSRITPVYESTATMDIDRQTPTGVIGQEASRSALNDSDQYMATQIRLIQSDSVLRGVAERHGLLKETGEARSLWNYLASRPPERNRKTEGPVVLKNLRVSRPPNTYLLQISYRSTDPELAARVSNAIAQSYLEHTYNIRIRSSASLSTFMEKQLEELRAKMERSSHALTQFERELNVINPEEKTSILSARLLQLNTEYTNAQAERVRREAVLSSVQSGTMEAAQASQQGEDLRKLNDRLNESMEKFAEVRAHFGANHPEHRRIAAQVAELQRTLERTRANIAARVEVEYRQASRRESMLRQTVADTKTELDRLNARSYEYQSLKREAEADKKLYEELVRKIKEAGINAGFQNSGIRLADPARPADVPVFPNIKLSLLLALFLSSLAAVSAAVISDAVDNTIRDPDEVARTLNTEVIASLPAVKSWRGRLGFVLPSDTTAVVRASENEVVLSGYEEAVRTLRNSILLSDVDRRIRSLLVTSATPSEGKSTTVAHLALTHAQQGHRTLLIDADLRRPSIHKKFGLSAAKGLSTVLTSHQPWRELLLSPEGAPDLQILPAGPPSRRASDLIGRGLEELLAEASDEYDLVILDAPPLLGFAEPLQMATIVDGVIVVTRAGETERTSVANVLHTLRRLRANVLGVVLNEVHRGISTSYHYYGHYGKYYQSPKSA